MLVAVVAATAPYLWYRLHDYQQARIVTMFNHGRTRWGPGTTSFSHKLRWVLQGSSARDGCGAPNRSWNLSPNAAPTSSLQFLRRVWADWCCGLAGFIPVRCWTKPCSCVQDAGQLFAPVGGEFGADILFLCFRQCCHGHGSAAGCRYPATADQLWGNFDGHLDGGVRDHNGCVYPSTADELMSIGYTR